jgi:hypothetical protein
MRAAAPAGLPRETRVAFEAPASREEEGQAFAPLNLGSVAIFIFLRDG